MGIEASTDWKGSEPWIIDRNKHLENEYNLEYNGYKYRIKRGGVNAWCGYVAIPSTHKIYNDSSQIEAIDMYGGITAQFSEGDLKYIGFDTAHINDYIPTHHDFDWNKCPECKTVTVDLDKGDCNSELHKSFKTYEFVETECKRVIDYLISIQ